MESRLIYAASDSLKYQVNWVKVSPDTEWIYFGSGDEANKPLALKFITDYFPDSSICVAINRKHSITVTQKDLANSIANILGIKNFFIWDVDFKKVIEFSNIGVMRRGYI